MKKTICGSALLLASIIVLTSDVENDFLVGMFPLTWDIYGVFMVVRALFLCVGIVYGVFLMFSGINSFD